MLSDNIRNYRKENNMSQDDLAEKLGVSRQSVSLWETGQSQPTIDNIIALTKIFNVSTDAILGTADNTVEASADSAETQDATENVPATKKKNKTKIIISVTAVAAVIIIGGVIWLAVSKNSSTGSEGAGSDSAGIAESAVVSHTEGLTSDASTEEPGTDTSNSVATDVNISENRTAAAPQTPQNGGTQTPQDTVPQATQSAVPQAPQDTNDFDLFTYCKDYAIKIGTLNGDYTFYQQSAARYGGNSNEYFSISYWGDSNMVEFCLHCPLDDTYSENFYLRMRGGYNKKYEYLTSRYFRTDGTSLRSASGYIDPAVFSDSYPLNCDSYQGSTDGQNAFMEESRIGMCDLIHCLKNFVEVENMGCDFSVFEFVNY